MSLIVLYYVVIRMMLGAPLDTLVDRDHGLPSWYDPGLNVEAVQAWEMLHEAAVRDEIELDIFSGYRDYAYQIQVYRQEVARREDNADLYVAMPGHSEHQLGTAFDVVWPGVALGALDPRNELLYAWLEDHSHQYGFVLSYPLKSIDVWPFSNRFLPVITEYIYEPWHIRFVGLDLAQMVYEAGYLDPNSTILPQDFFSAWP